MTMARPIRPLLKGWEQYTPPQKKTVLNFIQQWLNFSPDWGEFHHELVPNQGHKIPCLIVSKQKDWTLSVNNFQDELSAAMALVISHSQTFSNRIQDFSIPIHKMNSWLKPVLT